jgi:ankyrin repeat protein
MKVFIMLNVIKLKSKKSKFLLTGLALAVGLSCVPSQAAQGRPSRWGWFAAGAAALGAAAYVGYQYLMQPKPIQIPTTPMPTITTKSIPSTLTITPPSSLAATTTTATTATTVTVSQQTLTPEKRAKMMGQELIEAATEGNLKRVNALIVAGANLNHRDKWHKTALMWAADGGNTQVVEALIEARADVNAQDKWRKTALMWAAQNGHIEVIEALIKAEANLNLQNQYGRTALMLAAPNNQIQVVEALIKEEANPNFQDVDGMTALAWAAYRGHIEIVEALIKAEADVNLQGKDSDTALMWATRGGHIRAAKALIQAGADVSLQDNCGNTALMWAASEGHIEVVQALIRARADVNLQDEEDGHTALIKARMRHHPEIATLLETYQRATEQNLLHDAIVLSNQHGIHRPVATLAWPIEATNTSLEQYFPRMLVPIIQGYLLTKENEKVVTNALKIAARETRIVEWRPEFAGQTAQAEQKRVADHFGQQQLMGYRSASDATMTPMSSLMTTIPSTSVATLLGTTNAQSTATK